MFKLSIFLHITTFFARQKNLYNLHVRTLISKKILSYLFMSFQGRKLHLGILIFQHNLKEKLYYY